VALDQQKNLSALEKEYAKKIDRMTASLHRLRYTLLQKRKIE
jgi:hypothetical protein